MTPTRLIGARAALLCASAAVTLAAAEVATRVFLPQDLGSLAPWYQSHPVYRVRHYPDMNEARSWVLPYHLRTNSRGIRADDEEPYDSTDERRIVVHGDSLTFGVGVENRDTFVQRLQRRLQPVVPGVDVLNLGVGGHGPDQEYLYFLEEGRRYAPRICVIAVCLSNDLDDLTRPLAAFRLDGDRLTYVPYEVPLVRRFAETRAYRWLTSRSHLLVLMRWTFVDAPLHAEEAARVTAQEPPLALAAAVYADFVQAIRDEGAVPLILLLPDRDEVASHPRTTTAAPVSSSASLRGMLLELCAVRDVVCVDALDALARAPVPADRLFLPDDGHFSAAGHAVIADVLAGPLEHLLDGSGSR